MGTFSLLAQKPISDCRGKPAALKNIIDAQSQPIHHPPSRVSRHKIHGLKHIMPPKQLR
jgi:hypothetical protein